MKKLSCVAVVVLSMISCVNSVLGNTITTVDCNGGGDYLTIQEGIDAAVNGDTVLVAPCTYTGTGNRDITYNGKAIVVMSSDGPESTIVDCQGSSSDYHRGFYFSGGESSSSVLEGFTITNGYVRIGGGIYCLESFPIITNSTITGCTASYTGGGIQCSSSSPAISNCTVTQNNSLGNGGGMFLNSSNPTITNCTISGNTVDDNGGGVYCNFSSPTITGCTISENATTNWDGGGINCYESSPSISNCTISDNTAASYGSGINLSSNSDPTISNCTVSGNIAGVNGGGISFSSSHPTILNCTIKENSAFDGGGIWCWSDSVSITNCTITGNTVDEYGGGIYFGDSNHTSIINCTIAENSSVDSGGGIYSGWSCDPALINCILWDDMPDEIYLDFGAAGVTYSDIDGGWAGTGNIDTIPLFADSDYHLQAGSNCIDAGDPSILDACRPPGRGGDASDMGAFGGANNCGWLEVIIDLFLYPQSTTVSLGDTLYFNTLAWNSTGNTISGAFWLSIILPNSMEVLIPSVFLNLPNPVSGQMPPHSSATLSNELQTLLTGTFTIIGRIGAYPNFIVDEESFTVQVTL